MQTTKENKENTVLDEITNYDEAVNAHLKQRYSLIAKFSEAVVLVIACGVAFAPDVFVARLATGAYLIVTMLQFSLASRIASVSGKTPDELRKTLDALTVVKTFLLFTACVVLAVSIVIPFSLRVMGVLVAFSSLRGVLKHIRNGRKAK